MAHELANGKKALSKKSFFLSRSEPDLDLASTHFVAAAAIFKTDRNYVKAVEALVLAAETARKLQSLFLSAEKYAAAALLISLHLPAQKAQACQLYETASNLYAAHGSTERSAECLEKAANLAESVDIAITLYSQAVDIYVNDDRLRSSVDTFTRGISYMLKNQRYLQASDLCIRLCDLLLKIDNAIGYNKWCLSNILILLAAGDEIAARKRLNDVGDKIKGDEGSCARDIMDAWEHGDQELWDSCVKGKSVLYLGQEIAKLAVELRLPGGSNAKPNVAAVVEDYEDGGFC